MRNFIGPLQIPQAISAGCKPLDLQGDLYSLLSARLPGHSVCGHTDLPGTLNEEVPLNGVASDSFC